VFEVRDIWPLLLYAAGKFSPRHPLCLILRMLERLGYRSADLIVGTMPNLAAHVEESIGRQRPVQCIPQGLEDAHLAKPAPLPSGYAETYIPRDSFVICYAGSIGADNALETLFACARAMQHRRDVQFLIVGDGYLKSHFQALCTDLENVTFAPRVEKAAVQSVLAEVDVVYFAVHRSPALRFGQSLNKLIDYMASAKPVLASYTGFPSMITEAGCGTIVPAEDVEALRSAIEQFADMAPADRIRMGARGRQWLIENRTYKRLSGVYLSYLGVASASDIR
jgi:glycosyltransferase involved in cell wall biosynthesis